MNDLELYREQLSICVMIRSLTLLVERSIDHREDHGIQRRVWYADSYSREQEDKAEKTDWKIKLAWQSNTSEEICDMYSVVFARNSKRIQARKLFDYNIVLIGFMGAGKSTISDYLSTMYCDMEIVEMDQVNRRERRDEYSGYFCYVW